MFAWHVEITELWREWTDNPEARSAPFRVFGWYDTGGPAHLGRLDGLARAGRLGELAVLAETDNRARRRLDRQLHDEGRADELRARAVGGDRTALLLLIRLLRARGEDDAARQVVQELATTGDDYAVRLAHGPLPEPWPPSPAG
ncbi:MULTISPECIES: hypothetical protein [Catenuloplanes]|uniref:Phage gp46-like protein n=1 Tax=Catenuloplanes niger TaxID=587534 RepID=A0AAE3ZW41_9ACTN|nr:hypothetical protein [Catenuloplanes niger]MDR7326962.1 phage gp46-like protein [Catenuloplanes niger]